MIGFNKILKDVTTIGFDQNSLKDAENIKKLINNYIGTYLKLITVCAVLSARVGNCF